MKSLSLKWKIILASGVPLVCLVVFALNHINEIRSTMEDAKKTRNQVELIGFASEVINETQKERGKTAVFLNGGTTLADLSTQREANDRKINALKNEIPKSTFDKKYKDEILENVSKIEELREKVSSKSINLKQALGSYTGIIKRLLQIQSDVADWTSLSSVTTKLRGFRIIEDAKESGGKLRANMSGVLAKNAPINRAKFAAIVNLKAGVDTNLSSSALKTDDKGKEYISRFKNSSGWSTTNNVFELILKNSDNGKYNKDAKEFFGTITGALNIIGEFVLYTKADLLKNIKQIESKTQKDLRIFSIFLGALILAIMFFILYIVKTANQSIEIIKRIGLRVAEEANEVSHSSESISSISATLSDASTHQAASLQETVSSIDEISSMIQRNADSAKTSTQISNQSNEVAEKGKSNVQQMVSSIKEISNSNSEAMSEMSKSNQDLSKIVSVISDIGEKTKIINDIVFQTKLLSFNASVEAARAGEHGKGFAVVAEEVGNLAAMSGKAALEISEMLDTSTTQVKNIAESSKKKVEDLIHVGKEKVDSGIKTANNCSESLDEILKNASTVNEMVQEIAHASSEQAIGVQEVTKAMQQLDQVTHQNSTVAQEASGTAKKLKDRATSLNHAVKELMTAVNGGKVSDEWMTNEVAGNKPSPAKIIPIDRKNEGEQKAAPSPPLKEAAGLGGAVPKENDPRFEDF